MQNIKPLTLFIATILVYVPFHVFEEAAGNFPLFMHENWGIPDIGYARWLFHNIALFVPVLVAGLFVFSLDEDRMLPFGVGITLWGVMNFYEHLFYTLKNAHVAPGLFSSILFVVIAIAVFITLIKTNALNPKTIGLSFFCAFAYWALPIALIMILSGPVGRILR